MLNKTLLKQELEQYKKDLPMRWPDEKYKWEAIRHFRKNWKIDADDFSGMLKNALKKTGNLLSSQGHYPGLMMFRFAEHDPEAVRKMYRDLFNDSSNIINRIIEFRDRAVALRDKYEQGLKHYQDEHAISTYLWLNFPDKYFIYKFKLGKKINNIFEGSCYLKMGNFGGNFSNFYDFYEEIRAEICKDKELKFILQNLLTPECYADPDCVTLTMDFGYYLYQREQQSLGPAPSPDPRPDTDPDLEGGNTPAPPSPNGGRYWWLTCKPKIWSMSDWKIGAEQSYTFYTEKGNPRHIFKNFQAAKVGDIVLGYESSPIKKIVAVFEISGIRDESIFFKKVRNLDNPVDFATIANTPELQNLEYIKKLYGSLFKVTEDEYECIMNLANKTTYGKRDFLEEVFMSEKKYEYLTGVLEAKRNIILKGVPGVGKTFAARRLAYSIMGTKDESKIKFIQFHQNYSYEDFMMGYKPSDNGNFALKYGVFYRFCKDARKEPDKKFFLIIDEINRGNMSKIFGELLMLIEKKYRDNETITLPYNDEEFSVPDNLYIIGMMNTADRSLAMIDYALRRRFGHFELEPAFDSEQFIEYKDNLKNPVFNELIDKIKELNVAITEDNSLGKDFRIGHSYFCDLTAEECTPEKMRSIVKYEILPTLEEYWFDDSTQVEKWKNELNEVLNVTD